MLLEASDCSAPSPLVPVPSKLAQVLLNGLAGEIETSDEGDGTPILDLEFEEILSVVDFALWESKIALNIGSGISFVGLSGDTGCTGGELGRSGSLWAPWFGISSSKSEAAE